MAPFALLFVVLSVLLPAGAFFDLYLLPWQTRLIFLEHPNFWHAMRDDPSAYLPVHAVLGGADGPLFYYPMGLWVFALDKAGLIDMRAWSDFGLATHSFRYTALLKVPNLVVYLGTGVVLMRMLPGPERRRRDAALAAQSRCDPGIVRDGAERQLERVDRGVRAPAR